LFASGYADSKSIREAIGGMHKNGIDELKAKVTTAGKHPPLVTALCKKGKGKRVVTSIN
jgi:hypothetical protein